MKTAFNKSESFPEERLYSKKILITGATGLIGYSLTKFLIELNQTYCLKLQLLLLVRESSKKKPEFLEFCKYKEIKIIYGDVCNLPYIQENIDYIIHGASITVSELMIKKPVEVIKTNLEGTANILELAKTKQINSMVYLSTMEVYGFTEEEKLLAENDIQYLNPLLLRSSYPESKRMAENLCVSYASEYGIPVKIIRLAQTFGYGVKSNDTRVFAEFARCALEKKTIRLLTDGTSKRMYLDTGDAARAIFIVLTRGKNGEAYNAANKNTYCSIKEMAELVSKEIADGKINIEIENKGHAAKQFPPAHKLMLDVSKLENLGWHPEMNLRDMYLNMIKKWIED